MRKREIYDSVYPVFCTVRLKERLQKVGVLFINSEGTTGKHSILRTLLIVMSFYLLRAVVLLTPIRNALSHETTTA